MSQDTGGDIDEIPEEFLDLRTEEAGKAAREALRIRFGNITKSQSLLSGYKGLVCDTKNRLVLENKVWKKTRSQSFLRYRVSVQVQVCQRRAQSPLNL